MSMRTIFASACRYLVNTWMLSSPLASHHCPSVLGFASGRAYIRCAYSDRKRRTNAARTEVVVSPVRVSNSIFSRFDPHRFLSRFLLRKLPSVSSLTRTIQTSLSVVSSRSLGRERAHRSARLQS